MEPGTGCKRIGVFGGTFDPIHFGHLVLAVEAKHRLRLDRVFLVPAGDPPHKQASAISPLHHRLAMCRLAVAEDTDIDICLIDAERPGPHYTSDLLRILLARMGGETQIFFLMGLDGLRDLATWHEPDWLVQNCRLVALRRHEVEINWAALERSVPAARERVVVLDMPELEISGSVLRERVRDLRPIRYQVPRAVERYIEEHGLYSS